MPARRSETGFTLIELVVGISTFSIALLIMTGALFPQAEKSTDPWFQVRSAELAQSVMNEVMSRRYDENSSLGLTLRCDEAGASACTTIGNASCTSPITYAWAEEGSSNKDLFDDVDDFHCYTATGNDIRNIENATLNNIYKQFTVSVTVTYAGTDLGLTAGEAKLITVTVTPPKGTNVEYSSYKANY